MKTGISGLDLHFLVKEFKILEGGKLQKVIQGEDFLYFDLYVTNRGKIGLMMRFPSFVYFTGEKPAGKPHGFGQYIIKHFLNSKCLQVSQVGLERIFFLEFSTKEGKLFIYFELFDKGNVVICKDDIVLHALVSKKWKNRIVKRGIPYEMPPARINVAEVKKNHFVLQFENRKGETISSILAIDFGLGGHYAEEICIRAKIDPKKKDFSEKDAEKVFKEVQHIFKEKIEPHLVLEGDTILDVVPFSFEKYKDKKQQKLESFHSGIAQAAAVFEEKVSPYEKKIRQIKTIIEKQQKQLDMVKEGIQLNTFTGDMIYSHYNEVDKVLGYIQKKEKSWEEMKKELLKVRFIRSVDEKKGKFVVEFEK